MKMMSFDTRFFAFSRTTSPLVELAQVDFALPKTNSDEKPPPSASQESEVSISPAPSLEFRDEESFFSKPHVATVTFPDSYDVLHSSQNGTLFAQAAAYATSPQRSSEMLRSVAYRRASSLNLWALRRRLGELTSTLSDSASDHLIHSMDGYDAVEIYDKATSWIPSVSFPKMRQIDKLIDDVIDALPNPQNKHTMKMSASDSDIRGSNWDFAWTMGRKAKKALVGSGICQDWQIQHRRDNMEWQFALDEALAKFYDGASKEYTFAEMLSMTPVWIGARREKVWRLVLDTGLVEVGIIDGKSIDVSVQLYTGFELPEDKCMANVQDYTRSSNSVEKGDWEEVESTSMIEAQQSQAKELGNWTLRDPWVVSRA